MDNLNFTDFLIADSEAENIAAPEIKAEHPIYKEPIDEEQVAIRKRRASKEKEVEWQGGSIQKDFWAYDYDNSKEAIISKTKKMSVKLIIFIIAVVLISSISSIILFVKSLQSKPTDVTKIVRYDEPQFSKTLGLYFSDSDVFAQKVRVFSEDKVTAKTDGGFGIVFIGGKQQGIFIDSTKYTLYGLRVDDKCDENFSKTTFMHDKVYSEVVDYSAGFKNYCYLYNTGTGDCMIVSYDTRTNKILELGYFYNYKTILYHKI